MLGIWARKLVVDHERRASLNSRIIEKRIEIYETIGNDLNDIYVFLRQEGHWKELSPSQIIEKKRNVDKVMYVNRPYWSDVTFAAFLEFTYSAFKTHTGVGEDAKIKADTRQFKELYNDRYKEDNEWKCCFSKEPTDTEEIEEKYSLLMKNLSREFGFYQK